MGLFRRLSYANVMATLALFVGLSGTAVAGSQALFTGANIQDRSLTGETNHSPFGVELQQLLVVQVFGAHRASPSN